jgi:hypothetical protein
MKERTLRTVLLGFVLLVCPLIGQAPQTKTTYVNLRSSDGAGDGVLHEPAAGAASHIAVVYTHIGSNNLGHASGPELARRGYRVFLLNHPDDVIGFEGIAPYIGAAVKYLRALPGVSRVVLLSHSGGGPVMTLYQNIAENGPQVCRGPEKYYPCEGNLDGLPKADGLILLDSHAGHGFLQLTYLDPANADPLRRTPRAKALDMFDPANGYDAARNGATYSDAFIRQFFAAQAARNERVTSEALARLAKIEAGTGEYADDEPFVVPESSEGRLLQPDVRLLSRTKAAHPLLKADGTTSVEIVYSVRPPMGRRRVRNLASAIGQASYGGALKTSVRRYLATYALRTTKDYGMTEDSITGVDWASSSTSAPSNIQGVTVPLLIMSMTCHYWMTSSELLFDRAASKDKEIVFVEGASHGFSPCRPEYGDTVKRTFDHAGAWLSSGDRFSQRDTRPR